MWLRAFIDWTTYTFSSSDATMGTVSESSITVPNDYATIEDSGNSKKTGYSSPSLDIVRRNTRDHYLINGESHAATGTYTFNENTTIQSVYNKEMIYPDIPTIDDDKFLEDALIKYSIIK